MAYLTLTADELAQAAYGCEQYAQGLLDDNARRTTAGTLTARAGNENLALVNKYRAFAEKLRTLATLGEFVPKGKQ